LDCALFLHENGQWAKKVKGKAHYFGSDKDVAINRWVDEQDYLLAGRTPPKQDGNPTIAKLANVIIANKRGKVKAEAIESCNSLVAGG